MRINNEERNNSFFLYTFFEHTPPRSNTRLLDRTHASSGARARARALRSKKSIATTKRRMRKRRSDDGDAHAVLRQTKFYALLSATPFTMRSAIALPLLLLLLRLLYYSTLQTSKSPERDFSLQLLYPVSIRAILLLLHAQLLLQRI